MSIFDSIKNLARPYEDDEDDLDYSEENTAEEEVKDEPAVERRPARRAPRASAPVPREPEPIFDTPNNVVGLADGRRSANAKDTTVRLQVVLVQPTGFDDAKKIANHVLDRRTVVLNLESCEDLMARRLLDFLTGVAYALDGSINRAANATYVITPHGMSFQGELMEALENSGITLNTAQ